MSKFINIYYLESLLTESDIGIAISISNRQTLCWSLWMYLGDSSFIELYQTNKGINQTNFDIINGEPSKNDDHIIFIKELKRFNYLEYSKLNLNILKTNLSTLKDNLLVLDNIENGDIVEFDRHYYYHAGILIDTSRMIIAHRYGEVFFIDSYWDMFLSVIGIPITKTNIIEHNLFDICFNNKFYKQTDKYDNIYKPKPNDQILEDIKVKIGTQDKYSVVMNNCQHFVSECRNGHQYSPGIEIIHLSILITLIISILTYGLIISFNIFKYFDIIL